MAVKEIVLANSRGIVRVDDEDYDRLMQYKWRVLAGRGPVYARTTIADGPKKRKTIMMHTMIMGTDGIDHADGDGLNNQKYNLRKATLSQQNANRRTRNKSGLRGVTFLKSVQAYSTYLPRGKRYKSIYLGLFKDKEAAGTAYDKKALELYGDFARLNFPEKKEEYLYAIQQTNRWS